MTKDRGCKEVEGMNAPKILSCESRCHLRVVFFFGVPGTRHPLCAKKRNSIAHQRFPRGSSLQKATLVFLCVAAHGVNTGVSCGRKDTFQRYFWNGSGVGSQQRHSLSFVTLFAMAATWVWLGVRFWELYRFERATLASHR